MIVMQIATSSRNFKFKILTLSQISLFEEKRFFQRQISTLLNIYQILSKSRPEDIYESENNW